VIGVVGFGWVIAVVGRAIDAQLSLLRAPVAF